MAKRKASTPDFRKGFNHGFMGVLDSTSEFSFETPTSEYLSGYSSGESAYKKREMMKLLTGDRYASSCTERNDTTRVHGVRHRV